MEEMIDLLTSVNAGHGLDVIRTIGEENATYDGDAKRSLFESI